MTTQELQGIADRVLPGTTVVEPESFLAFLEDQGRRVASGQQVAQLAVEQEDEGDGGFLGFLTRSLVDEDVLNTIRDQGFFGRIGANVLGELTNPLGIASTALLATGVGAPVGAALRGAGLAARGATAGSRLLAPAGRAAALAGRGAGTALTPASVSARAAGPSGIIRSPSILGRSLAAEAGVAGGAIAGGGVAQEVGQVIPGPTRSTPGQLGLAIAGGVAGGGATAGAFNRVLDQDAALRRSFAQRSAVEDEIPELTSIRRALQQTARTEPQIQAEITAERGRRVGIGEEARRSLGTPQERAAAARQAQGGRIANRSRFLPLAEELDATRPRPGEIPQIGGVTERGREFGVTKRLITQVGERAEGVYADDSFRRDSAIQAFNELLLGEVPTPANRRLLRPVVGDAFIDQIETVIGGRGRRAYKLAVEIAGFPRTIAGSFDVSSVLRQGGPLNISHPRTALKAWKQGFKAIGSEQYADSLNQEHLNHSGVRLVNAGLPENQQLYIAPLDEAVDVTRRSEQFISPVASNLPGIKQSAQFFTTNRNATVIGVLEDRLKTLEAQFPDVLGPGGRVVDPVRFRNWSIENNRNINALMGRGTLGFLEQPRSAQLRAIRDFLAISFWSPRLLLSRFQALINAVRAGRGAVTAEDPAIRALSREMSFDIAKYVGGVMGAVGLVSLLPGVTVEGNPKSSDFGKVRLGNTRIDPWAGFQQVGRYGTQFITGERKAATDGTVRGVDRDRILGQFLRSKLAPGLPSLTASDLPEDFILSGLSGGGENFIGEPITGGDVTPGAGARSISAGTVDQLPAELNVVIDQMVPLLAQDIAEALEGQGLIPGTTAAVASAFGLGSTSFGEGTQSEFVRDSDDASRGQDPRVAIANRAFR